MKLLRVSWKNFKSYGNVMVEIDFTTNQSLNLIVGANGTGKSCISEVITYCAYGKLDNMKSSEIPNRINKNFYGKIELDCEGHYVVIERGLAPNLFNVVIDGQVVDTAGKVNVQEMLEEQYYKIPYSVFKNLIILSINDFKSLVDLNAADKRNIIDKIFGFSEYNNMLKMVKEDLKNVNFEVSINEGSLKSSTQNLESYNSRIQDIESNSCTQEEIDELKSKLTEALELRNSCEDSLKKLSDARTKLSQHAIEQNGDIRENTSRIQTIDKKIALIDSGRCPTCGSSLETEEFKEERKKLLEERDVCESNIKTIRSLQEGIKSKIGAIERKEQQLYTQSRNTGVSDIQGELKYKMSLKETSVDPILELKKQIEEQIVTLREERNELDEKKRRLDLLVKMFGEDGLKKMIASTYIPLLNNILKEMMDFMGLNYNITFDNSFNTVIMSNGCVIGYSTLSTGEKKRVDFATVVSFIKLLKVHFGELNLLFLDELFSNIDVNGVVDMLELLKELSSDLHLNIYLIHHAQLESVLFDKVIETTKPDGFSQLEFVQ